MNNWKWEILTEPSISQESYSSALEQGNLPIFEHFLSVGNLDFSSQNVVY